MCTKCRRKTEVFTSVEGGAEEEEGERWRFKGQGCIVV
jgi:hypothetical protein